MGQRKVTGPVHHHKPGLCQTALYLPGTLHGDILGHKVTDTVRELGVRSSWVQGGPKSNRRSPSGREPQRHQDGGHRAMPQRPGTWLPATHASAAGRGKESPLAATSGSTALLTAGLRTLSLQKEFLLSKPLGQSAMSPYSSREKLPPTVLEPSEGQHEPLLARSRIRQTHTTHAGPAAPSSPTG